MCLKQVSSSYEKLSESVAFNNVELTQLISNQTEKIKIENSGRVFDDSTNKLCNRISNYGQAITNSYLKNRDCENKIAKNEMETAKKVPRDEFKAKVKKTKLQLNKKVILKMIMMISQNVD